MVSELLIVCHNACYAHKCRDSDSVSVSVCSVHRIARALHGGLALAMMASLCMSGPTEFSRERSVVCDVSVSVNACC